MFGASQLRSLPRPFTLKYPGSIAIQSDSEEETVPRTINEFEGHPGASALRVSVSHPQCLP